MKKKLDIIALLVLSVFPYSCHKDADAPNTSPPPGAPKETKTQVLETGAAIMQNFTPIKQIDMYLNAFHPMKGNFSHQVEAHHYCQQLNEDFAQCVLYDGNTATARMTGIEYIVSEKIFLTLPKNEKKYWHPHNYEILSGQLVAPGLPDELEKQALKRKMNSYGKTWHVWMTNRTGNTMSDSAVPMGDPQLAWSFTNDGQVNPNLIQQRDKRLNINTGQKAQQRKDLRSLVHPQVNEDGNK